MFTPKPRYSTQMQRAADYNRRARDSVSCWPKSLPDSLRGSDPASEAFANAVADWQLEAGLAPDGMLGPATLQAMQGAGATETAPHVRCPPCPRCDQPATATIDGMPSCADRECGGYGSSVSLLRPKPKDAPVVIQVPFDEASAYRVWRHPLGNTWERFDTRPHPLDADRGLEAAERDGNKLVRPVSMLKTPVLTGDCVKRCKRTYGLTACMHERATVAQ